MTLYILFLRFLIHGWGSGGESSMNTDGTAVYLNNADFNVIRSEN
jgi:hypothetical protein